MPKNPKIRHQNINKAKKSKINPKIDSRGADFLAIPERPGANLEAKIEPKL